MIRGLIRLIIAALLIMGLDAGQSRLTLLRTFPAENSQVEDDYLIHPYDLKVCGEFYVVADAADHCIKIFNKNGDFVRRVGKFGQGPGDLDTVFRISLDRKGGLIYAADGPNGRISCFRLTGEPSALIKTFLPPLNVIFFEGFLHVCAYNPYLQSLFSVYDSSGALIKTYGELFDKKIPSTRWTPYCYENLTLDTFNDNICVLFEFIPYVSVYSQKGELRKRIAISDKRILDIYEKNIAALNKGPIRGNLKVFPWNNGGCIYGNSFYYLSNFKHNSGEEVLVVNSEGEVERNIPFDKGAGTGYYRLVAIDDGDFIFADWQAGEIKIYREK